MSVLGITSGGDVHAKDDWPEAKSHPHLCMVRMEASMMFTNVNKFHTFIFQSIRAHPWDLAKQKTVLIDFRGVNNIDYSGLCFLSELVGELSSQGIELMLVNLNSVAVKKIERMPLPLLEKFRAAQLCINVTEAIDIIAGLKSPTEADQKYRRHVREIMKQPSVLGPDNNMNIQNAVREAHANKASHGWIVDEGDTTDSTMRDLRSISASLVRGSESSEESSDSDNNDFLEARNLHMYKPQCRFQVETDGLIIPEESNMSLGFGSSCRTYGATIDLDENLHSRRDTTKCDAESGTTEAAANLRQHWAPRAESWDRQLARFDSW